jgi:hypothetical protein
LDTTGFVCGLLGGLHHGLLGKVSPGEPPLHFFCFLFLSYFLFLNSVLIQI